MEPTTTTPNTPNTPTTPATTIHAWFSAETALATGSSVYRKPDGSTVNVTRTHADFKDPAPRRQDERYVGQVTPDEAGGCVRANSRVRGITG